MQEEFKILPEVDTRNYGRDVEERTLGTIILIIVFKELDALLRFPIYYDTTIYQYLHSTATILSR